MPASFAPPRYVGAELDDDEDETLAYVRAETAEEAACEKKPRPAAGNSVRLIVMDGEDATAQAIPKRLVFDSRNPIPTAPEIILAEAGQKRRRPWWPVWAAVALAGMLTTLWYVRPQTEPKPIQPTPTAAVAEAPVSKLEVDVPTPEARLYLDGRPVTLPLRLTLPRDFAEHELRGEAPGYYEKSHRFRLDRDVTVVLGLDPAKKNGR
jgi:hypothetical protein